MGDWTAGCDDLHVLDQSQMEQCKQRRTYRKTASAANGLGSALVNSINSDYSTTTSVYMVNIDEELTLFLTQHNINVFTIVDLNEYLDFHFGDCEYIRQRSSIVLHQLQLELAVLGESFYYSFDSQWSYGALLERQVRNANDQTVSNNAIISSV